jgi:predicted transcriptional regulator
MKTTIELPDATFRKAKVIAAERHTTLKEIVTQALESFLRTPPRAEEKARKATLKRLLKEMQATNSEPMKPLTREQIHDR